MTESHPALADVEAAADRIASMITRTPVIPSPALSALVGHEVLLKLENTQRTGSFKLRGAASFLIANAERAKEHGVAAVSSGNHGRAVALVAAELGVAATVFLTTRVPPIKVAAISDLGAEIVIAGATQDEAEHAAREHVEASGALFVHPYDDPLVIAGQGTIALELAADRLDLAEIIVPLSGGGLISGIAMAAKSIDPGVVVTGVSQEMGAAMHESLGAGAIVDVLEEDTLADALAGGLAVPNRHTFDMCRRHVDRTVLVSEHEIGEAMAFMQERHGHTVEGGGAVGVAAILASRVEPHGRAAVIVSGGNVDEDVLRRVAG